MSFKASSALSSLQQHWLFFAALLFDAGTNLRRYSNTQEHDFTLFVLLSNCFPLCITRSLVSSPSPSREGGGVRNCELEIRTTCACTYTSCISHADEWLVVARVLELQRQAENNNNTPYVERALFLLATNIALLIEHILHKR